MQIPQSQTLTTRCLSRIFDTTSATYKFFYLLFISSLCLYQKNYVDVCGFLFIELMTHLEHYRSSEGYQIKFAQFYDTRYSLILYNNTVVL